MLIDGQWLATQPTVITDGDAKADILDEFVRRNGTRAAKDLMLGLPADRQPDRAELLAATSKTTVVRFALAPDRG